MNLDDALQTFIIESRELLHDMEAALLSQEQAEMVNAVFRAAHTIKGSAGLFGLNHIVAFTHVVESVLEQVRSGRLTLADPPLVALLLASCDQMGALIEGVAAGEKQGNATLLAEGENLMHQLSSHLVALNASVPSADTEKVQSIGGDSVYADHWHISVRFSPDVLRHGMEPLSFIRYLERVMKFRRKSKTLQLWATSAFRKPQSAGQLTPLAYAQSLC